MVARTLNLSKLLGKKSSALLLGARGVGKTKIARACVGDLVKAGSHVIEYNLLHSDTYERLLKRPHLFRLEVEKQLKEKSNVFVFIDEVQKIPPLLDEVHGLLEQYPGKTRFLLTGSSARKLKRSGANLLAGRAMTLKLHPLTFDEYPISIFETARLGSLPGIIIDNENSEQALRSYVSTYLKEEIQQEAIVRRIEGFARFLEVAAQYHTEPINASNIAKYAGVSSQTVGEYVQILEDTLIAHLLPGWHASKTKQLRSTSKLYLFDNGVCNVLQGEIKSEVTEGSTRFGKLFEAMLIQQAIRLNDYHSLDLNFSYWRTNNDTEVDLIISRGAGKPIAAIEIKSTTLPENKHLHGLLSFAKDYPKVPLYCLCRSEKDYTLSGVEILSTSGLSPLLRSL